MRAVGGLGCGCSVIAVLFAVIGLVPLLGWLNWITTVPAALLAILFSALALARGQGNGTATLGLIVGVVTLFWALFRLSLGFGIF